MKHLHSIIFFAICLLVAQTNNDHEFQINSISGSLTNSTTGNPISEGKIEIFSGNFLNKGKTYSKENGQYILGNVGYVWKPKLVVSASNYKSNQITLNLTELDLNLDLHLDIQLTPIPENQKIPSISINSLSERAEMFFREGNVFYYLSRIGKHFSSERIVIQKIKIVEKRNGNLMVNINGQHYDPLGCYIPQLGRYENLAMILDEYFPKPVFHSSGYPMFLSNNHLESNEIFGTVINSKTGNPVMGADIQIEGLPLHRVTAKDGKFRFKVPHSGEFKIIVRPPIHSGLIHVSQNKILLKQDKGGWIKSNQYLIYK